MRIFQAVVGKPSTPTPRGEFFVEEAIQLPAEDVGAPFALALSARSAAIQGSSLSWSISCSTGRASGSEACIEEVSGRGRRGALAVPAGP